MLNNKQFKLLAGNPETWDEQIRLKCSRGKIPLADVQKQQYAEGRRSITLAKHSELGWVVRSDTSLDNFKMVFAHSDIERALAYGIDWANEDPYYLEFYARRQDLVGTSHEHD